MDSEQITLLVFGYIRNIKPQNRIDTSTENTAVIPNDIFNIVLSFHANFIPGCIGLINLGYTDFINAIIPCLSNTPHFRNYYLSDQYKMDINKTNPLGMQGQLVTEFANIMKQIWTADNNKPIAISSLERILSQFAPRFTGYQSQDAFEFLAVLLDGMHEDTNLILNKPSTEAVKANGRADKVVASLSLKMYLLRNQSKIVDLFHGQSKSQVICPKCNYMSATFDPFVFLSIPVPDLETCTIYDCMDEFVKQEALEGWYCRKCKDFGNGSRKVDLWSCPEILVIQFKRYSYKRNKGKNQSFIQYPVHQLDLSKYVIADHDDLCIKPIYNLYAVTNHKVAGFASGVQYYCTVKNIENGKWYFFSGDNSNVRVATENEITSSDSYVLFYTKCH